MTVTTEQLQTYEESGKPLGLMPRTLVHQLGYWHRAVNVFLFRSDGRLIVQRRSILKDVCPGLWDLSAAEHLVPGEQYLDAAFRGLAEELSVYPESLERFGGELRGSLEDHTLGIYDNEFQQSFRGMSDADITIDTEEVAEFDYIELDQLKQSMANSPERYTPWFIRLASELDLFDEKHPYSRK